MLNSSREAVFINGQFMIRVGGMYGNDWYKAPDSSAPKDHIIEWREFIKESTKKWKE